LCLKSLGIAYERARKQAIVPLAVAANVSSDFLHRLRPYQ
jgi:hypothetical protein